MLVLFYLNVFYFITTLHSFCHHSIPQKFFSFARPTADYLLTKQSFTLALSFRNDVPLNKEGTTGKAYPKLDFNEDYYSVLEISPTIPSSDLKKAYYKMVFKYHPDNKVGDELKALCNKQVRKGLNYNLQIIDTTIHR
jgi:hypothetical protein